MASRDGGVGGQASRGGGLVVHPLDVHEIDCTPCEQGCCGRRRIAIPEDLYQRLLMVKRAMEEASGQRIATCRVFNLFADVICTALGRVPRRPVSIKAVEEMISRELVYKSQYSLGRLAHAPDPRTAWSFIELGLRAWFLGIHRMLNVQPRLEAIEYINKLLGWWGVRNRYDFAWLLKNALNDPSLIDVEHAQGTRYTADIVGFSLTQATRDGDCSGVWPRPSRIDATIHLPTILTIIRSYLNCLGINTYLDYLKWLNDRRPPTRGTHEDDT
ncbi:MAG: hypothetical protein RXQ94_04235 [Caldivirga sp.]